MEPFVFIISLLGIGIWLQRFGFPEDFSKSLNLFVIYVSLPATVLLQIPNVHLDMSALSMMMVPWILLLLMVPIVLRLTRSSSPQVRAALLLVIPLGNTSFVGIPIIEALVGVQGIPHLLIYDQLGSFLMLSLYGTAVIAKFETGVMDKKAIVKKLFLFPPFLCLLFAFAYGDMPAIITPYLELLAHTLVPIALISVGFSLHLRGHLDYGLFSKALALKLIFMPLVALGLLWAMGVDRLTLYVGVLESGMPSMITAGALAMASGFAPRLSAALVGYGIVVSLVSLPLWLYFMERFF